ncbi:MAG TPA: hypothetical protein VG432_07835 [Gemmatimonadaceae bacterium]|nr:hypothetical protein [Gemmatimonadaceae bacterium]
MDPDVYSFAVVMGVIGIFIASMVGLYMVTKWIGRRMHPRAITPIDDDRFARLEQAVDTMAIEIERMTEAQRFTAKLLAERANAVLPGESR